MLHLSHPKFPLAPMRFLFFLQMPIPTSNFLRGAHYITAQLFTRRVYRIFFPSQKQQANREKQFFSPFIFTQKHAFSGCNKRNMFYRDYTRATTRHTGAADLLGTKLLSKNSSAFLARSHNNICPRRCVRTLYCAHFSDNTRSYIPIIYKHYQRPELKDRKFSTRRESFVPS